VIVRFHPRLWIVCDIGGDTSGKNVKIMPLLWTGTLHARAAVTANFRPMPQY
jgi:hypothetical protein